MNRRVPMARLFSRFIPMRQLAILLAAAASLGASQAPGVGDGIERKRLQLALETACQDVSHRGVSGPTSPSEEDRLWAQADTCRRAWFKAHEEAIWRLKLNPHARPVQAPSS